MNTIHMRYHLKNNPCNRDDVNIPAIRNTETFIHLSRINQYSYFPSPKNCDTAVAYSKGKLSAMPELLWDTEEEMI